MLKIKKIVNLILLGTIFHIIFSFEITPYAIYEYSSDSDLYPYENQSLSHVGFGVNFIHETTNLNFKSKFSYHLFSGINERPNSFNYMEGFGYIENNPGLSSKQFNYFLPSMKINYHINDINFYAALDNPIWGPGVNKIVLSDKAPPFFNIGYTWELTNRLSYEHLYGKLNSRIQDSTYLDLYDNNASRFAEVPRSINAHRIDYIISNMVNIGLFEMIIYGGSRSIEPYYFLPFIPFLPIQTYLGDLDNDLLGAYVNIDFKNIDFYSALVVDEWTQPDSFKKNHKNWFIYQFGMNFRPSIFDNLDQTLTIEYIRSDNRVYSHKFSINDFYSYEYPLGFWAGPHAEQIYLSYFQRGKKIDFKIEISHSKRGESVYGYNNNFIDRYSGIVERKQNTKLSTNYRYNKRIEFNFGFSMINWKNAGFNPLDENAAINNVLKKDVQFGINYHFKDYNL